MSQEGGRRDSLAAPPLQPLEAARERLARLLATSVGDATELLWIETRRGEASSLRREEPSPILVRRTVTVRVAQGPRLGRYTTEDGADGEIADALRIALAHARGEDPGPEPRRAAPWEPLPGQATAGEPANGNPAAGELSAGSASTGEPAARRATARDLFDPELASLEPRAAKALLERGVQKGEAARLQWATTRAVIVNSRGLSRAVELTGASLSIDSGRGPGGGFAQRAARTLARLEPAELAERARALRIDDAEPGEPPAGAVPLVLGPAAAAALVAHLATVALTAEAFAEGRVLAAADLGRQVLSPAFSLVDDGANPVGLPFPFDFEGRERLPVEMVAGGVLATPAVSPALAAALGLPVTPHYLGPDETRPQHLFVAPGGASRDELLAAGGASPEGGLWLAAFERVGSSETWWPGGPGFRAVCTGARRIVDGKLGPPLVPLLWQDDLRRVFSSLLGVGADATVRALDSELRGAVSAPSLAVAAGGSLRACE